MQNSVDQETEQLFWDSDQDYVGICISPAKEKMYLKQNVLCEKYRHLVTKARWKQRVPHVINK